MTRYGFFIDLSICAGCESCTVACQNKNGLTPDQTYTRVSRVLTGTFPDLTSTFVVNQCLHCDQPVCAEVCPTGASYKTAEGPVAVDDQLCIGCKYCIVACPYDARIFDAEKGNARKCTECAERLAAGRSPACVETCISGARMIGDLDDPSSAIFEALKRPGTFQMAGTSFFFRLPDGFGRETLPGGTGGTGVTGVWQTVLQPLGQLFIGGAAAALLVSAGSIAVRSVRGGGTGHGDQ